MWYNFLQVPVYFCMSTYENNSMGANKNAVNTFISSQILTPEVGQFLATRKNCLT